GSNEEKSSGQFETIATSPRKSAKSLISSVHQEALNMHRKLCENSTARRWKSWIRFLIPFTGTRCVSSCSSRSTGRSEKTVPLPDRQGRVPYTKLSLMKF